MMNSVPETEHYITISKSYSGSMLKVIDGDKFWIIMLLDDEYSYKVGKDNAQ